jgi:NAD(P)-dependent dehydrogenase (short-subunit alcohol dehydrogenase family)
MNPIHASVKKARRGMLKALAREWGPCNILVNGIARAAETDPTKTQHLAILVYGALHHRFWLATAAASCHNHSETIRVPSGRTRRSPPHPHAPNWCADRAAAPGIP